MLTAKFGCGRAEDGRLSGPTEEEGDMQSGALASGISVVIPVYNSEGTLRPLAARGPIARGLCSCLGGGRQTQPSKERLCRLDLRRSHSEWIKAGDKATRARKLSWQCRSEQ